MAESLNAYTCPANYAGCAGGAREVVIAFQVGDFGLRRGHWPQARPEKKSVRMLEERTCICWRVSLKESTMLLGPDI
jgi:hypothetical protein